MKKLVLLLAVAFSVSMFSCGNGNGKDGKDSVADTNAVPAAENVEATTEATTEEAAPVDTPTVEEAAPVADAQ